MTEIRESHIFVIIWIVYQCGSCHGRACVDSSLGVTRVQLVSKYEEKIEGTPDNFTLYTEISWKITSGNRSDFDGYLVKLLEPMSNDKLAPWNDCQASNEKLWITSKNESICDLNNNGTRNNCNTVRIPSSDLYSACDRKSSDAIDGVTYCTGSSKKLHRIVGGYYSIPNTRESVKYKIEFNHNYQFRIIPYQKQWMSTIYPKMTDIHANWFCPDVLASTFNIDSIEARKKCCESNVRALSPFGLNVSEPVLDKGTKTLNVTITWKPPSYHESLDGLGMSLSEEATVTHMPITEYITSGSVTNETGCPADNRTQSLTAYNLLPNTSYQFVIASQFNGNLAKTCELGKCGIRRKILLDFNPCDAKWNACDAGSNCIVKEQTGNDTLIPETSCHSRQNSVNNNQTSKCEAVSDYCDGQATCSLAVNGSVGLEKTCLCPDGLLGDGVNEKYNGSGCTGCPISLTCDPTAICEKLPIPFTGYQCQCDEYHYGDGLKFGTGCSSKAKRTITIVVPVVIACIIIFGLLTWCLVIRGRKKATEGI